MRGVDSRKLRHKILGWCPCCDKYFRWPVKVHRRHTRYIEQHLNFLCACKQCIEKDDEYFNAAWEAYYPNI